MKLLRTCVAAIACALTGTTAVAQTHGAGVAQTGPQRTMNARAGLMGASDALYTLHPGDTVDVSFRFTPEFNDEVVIGPDGRAALKATGVVELAGLSLTEAEQKVVLDSAARLVSPEVTVSLKDFDRPHVVVAGEVTNPGREELRRATTVIQAIMAAGGPKEDAAMGRVVLFRRINADTSEVHVLKLSRYDRGTRLKNDMVLEPDDAILVGHDNLESIGRFIKTIDLGIYLQPLNNSTSVF